MLVPTPGVNPTDLLSLPPKVPVDPFLSNPNNSFTRKEGKVEEEGGKVYRTPTKDVTSRERPTPSSPGERSLHLSTSRL